jgi:UDP-N-acetylmuramoyl-tripeptide--D-alanyl-D-alanine ligase
LPGNALLIDDTYNANPASLKAALETLKGWPSNGGRIMVGLGEMLELGDETVDAHFEAGRMVADLDPHLFVALGDHARVMIEGAIDYGLAPERTFVVNTHQEMVVKFRELMGEGDMIFLKGSRAMHLEKVAEGLRDQQHPK